MRFIELEYISGNKRHKRIELTTDDLFNLDDDRARQELFEKNVPDGVDLVLNWCEYDKPFMVRLYSLLIQANLDEQALADIKHLISGIADFLFLLDESARYDLVLKVYEMTTAVRSVAQEKFIEMLNNITSQVEGLDIDTSKQLLS